MTTDLGPVRATSRKKIQYDVTSQCLSLRVRFKKPRPILLRFLDNFDSLNPIEEHKEKISKAIKKILKTLGRGNDTNGIMDLIQRYAWPSALCQAVSAGIWEAFALLLVAGVQCRKQALLLPYMILHMATGFLFMTSGAASTVLIWQNNISYGIGCGIVVLIVSALIIYLWLVVHHVYVLLALPTS